MTLRGLPPRLRWYIVLVATAGLAASAAVVLLDPGHWDQSVWPRLAVLLVLTAASEIAGLRLPHRGALEMLNLYEGMVVANIALLPAGQAIAVSLAGLLVAQVVQRRAPESRAIFNLGSLRLRPDADDRPLPSGHRGHRAAEHHGMAPAMAVGMATFALVDLLLISQLLAVFEDRPVWDVVRVGQAVDPHLPGGLPSADRGRPVAARAGGPPARRSSRPRCGWPTARPTMQERTLRAPVRGRPAFASSLVLEEVLPNVLPKVARLSGREASLLFAPGRRTAFRPFHGPDGFRSPPTQADLATLAFFGRDGRSRCAGRPRPRGLARAARRALVARPAPWVIVLATCATTPRRGGPGMRLRRQDLQLLSRLASPGRHPRQRHPGGPDQGGEVDPGADPRALLGRYPAAGRQGRSGSGPGHGADLRRAGRRRCRPALERAVAGLDHDGKLVRLEDLLAAATPPAPGLGGGPDPHLRGPGARRAATTRCSTRAASGPPTW